MVPIGDETEEAGEHPGKGEGVGAAGDVGDGVCVDGMDGEKGGDGEGGVAVGAEACGELPEEEDAEKMEEDVGEMVIKCVQAGAGVVEHVGEGLDGPVVGGGFDPVVVEEVGGEGAGEVGGVADAAVFDDEIVVVPDEVVVE